MILALIRHGVTEANEKHLYCGRTDIALSDTGIIDLKIRAQIPKPFDPAQMQVITSGMLRCEQTLSLLFGDIPHTSDPAFREMDLGCFEMRSYEELKDDPAYITWISGDNEANIAPGGESGAIMRDRVLAALDRLIADGRDTILVTHAGVIAVIMAHLFPDENKNRYEWQPDPGEGYIADLGAHTYKPFS